MIALKQSILAATLPSGARRMTFAPIITAPLDSWASAISGTEFGKALRPPGRAQKNDQEDGIRIECISPRDNFRTACTVTGPVSMRQDNFTLLQTIV